jgi:Tfp pilus assembly protein PilV
VRQLDDDGVSLVEVMVAMGVFVVSSLSLLGVLSTTMAGTFDNRARVTAAQVAASDIDAARARGTSDYFSLGSDTYPKVVDGRTYTVVRAVQPTLSTGTTSSCVGSTSARQLYKRVTTTVTTPRARMKPVRADTLVKAPVYDPNSSTGAIGLVVIDRAGNPLPGLSAEAGGLTRTTDAKGCAFFDVLPAGTHTATVTRPGYVTIAGSPVLSRAVTVSAGQITAQVLRIDVAVNLTVNSTRCCTAPITSFVLPTGLTATLSSPDRTLATRVDYPAKTVVGGLDLTWAAFPSPAGYDAYLGPCQAAKHTDAEPGTLPPKVLLPLSTVRVQLSGGNASSEYARDKAVTATWLTTACTETLSFGTRTDATCKANANGTDGCFLSLAVPPGLWRFEIVGQPTLHTDAQVTEATSRSVTINVPL